MHKYEYQYVEDKLQIASSSAVNQAIWLCCSVFAFFSFAYPVLLIMDYINYGMIENGDIIFIVINLLSGLGFVGSLINLFLFLYFHQSILRYVRHLAMMTVLAIPGFITMFVVVSDPPLLYENSYLLPFIVCLLVSICFILLGYQIKRMRLRSAKSYHGGKPFSLFFIMVFLVILAGLGMQLLPIENISKYANLAVMLIFLIFISIWVGQMFLAANLITKFRQEFINFENITYNAKLHIGNSVEQRRLLILAPVYHETALNVLEEFGFVREKVNTAILAKQPIYTFVEGTRLDYVFLQRLLERLRYEDVAFVVEEEKNNQWIALDKAFHEQIAARNIHYVKQVKKETEASKHGWFGKVFGFILFMIFKAVYLVWTCIFPINYFMPVSYMSENQIKQCYNAFTYFNFRTFYHGLFMIFMAVFFAVSPDWHTFTASVLHGAQDVMPFTFIIVFVVEFIVFSIYLKRLQRVIQKTTRIHNHDKRTIYIILVLFVFRIYRKGWQIALVQVSFLLVTIECAKFLIISYRFLRNMKKIQQNDYDENYIFQEWTS